MKAPSDITSPSDAFLQYVELEEAGLDVEAYLAAHPDIAPEIETHRRLREIYSMPPPVETLAAPHLDIPLHAGECLGDFQIVRELGRGGMGVIYLAHQSSINRPVALKILSSRISGSVSLRKRFLKEPQAIGKLRHPNIVTVYSAGDFHGRLFIAMEYVPGVGLDKIISRLRRNGISICATNCPNRWLGWTHFSLRLNVRYIKMFAINRTLKDSEHL